MEIYENYSVTYERLGDLSNALKYYVKFKDVSDSLLEMDKQRMIAQLKLAYDVEKERSEKLILKSEILEKDLVVERRTRQRNTYLFSGTGIVAILIFLFTYYSQRTRKNRIINEQKIKQLEEEKKLLAARFLVEGQEEERKRIAKELHDGLGVLLSSAKMHFTTLRDKTPENKPLIDKAAKLLEQATGDVRRISHNMMPGLLTKYGLFDALEDLFEQVDEMKGIHASMIVEGEQRRLKENTEIMLYRIIQEMVNNTLKHAEAKNIRLEIILEPERMNVDYKDDGKGFDADEKIKTKSIGLTSIQSRVKFLNGEVTIQSEENKGSHFNIKIPQV
jgi:signal transduction histidine kinase